MPELYPEDQAKVDAFLKSSVNDVERKPFRPIFLLFLLLVILIGLSAIAFLVAQAHGVL